MADITAWIVMNDLDEDCATYSKMKEVMHEF